MAKHHSAGNSYAHAARILKPLLNQQGSLNRQFERCMPTVPASIQPAVKALCYQTMRFYPRVHQIACQGLHKKLKPKDQDIYALLLIGLTKLDSANIADQNSPDFAVINESVHAAKQLKKSWATGMVNANLRNYLRQRTHLEQQYQQDPVWQWMQPDWFIQAMQKNYGNSNGDASASSIMHHLNSPAPMTLRIHQQRTTREDYIHLLHQQGIMTRPGKRATTAIYLHQPTGVQQLPGFTDGLCSVQDEAAQLAAGYLEVQKEHKVLDACAAPGGKACHLLEQYPGLDLTCLELEPTRMAKIQHNMQRLHVSARIITGDACRQDWWDGRLFDRILLDAPCSGTGIMRRRPDIKLLRQATDIPLLQQQQQQMLTNLWSVLKPSGKLLYSTCSILQQENQQVMEDFVRTHPEAQLELNQQLLPQQAGHDGFYYARLAKSCS